MAFRELTPSQARSVLTRWRDDVPEVLDKEARRAAIRIGGTATSDFMRDAKGQGRRKSTDVGPLRIVRANLARAVGQQNNGVSGAINEIARQGWVVTLTKGVDLSVVPYARIHERGGKAGRNRSVSIPARPYLRPAARVETEDIRRHAARSLTVSLRRAVAGAVL